jgi:prevent-host-death family protein
MGTHSVAEAKNKLSDLIDRALEGEGVVITRHGRPVVELKPVASPVRQLTIDDLDWLAARRVGRPSRTEAGELVGTMRDNEGR